MSPWRVGASAGWSSTTIEFDSADVDLTQMSVIATVSHRHSATFGTDLGVGAVVGGELGVDPGGDIAGGVLVGLSGTWLLLIEKEMRPFIILTAGLAGSRVQAESDDRQDYTLSALDARVGVGTGKTFGPVTTYLIARGFGGPVSWHFDGREQTGGDAHHYTVGGGLTARFGALAIGAEGMPLGERSAVATASYGL